MQQICFVEFTTISQNTTQIEKSTRSDQIKKSMRVGKKSNLIGGSAIKKIKILQ
jgi:hypothetical protein